MAHRISGKTGPCPGIPYRPVNRYWSKPGIFTPDFVLLNTVIAVIQQHGTNNL